MKLRLIGMALILFTACATQPTIIDQAAAVHRSRMQDYAAIQDPEKRAQMERLENYRYQQFLAGVGAIVERNARMRMYEAQTQAANAQTAALSQPTIVAPQQQVSVPYMPSPQLPPQFGTYPGSRLNPIHVEVVPTPTPGTMFAPLPGSY